MTPRPRLAAKVRVSAVIAAFFSASLAACGNAAPVASNLATDTSTTDGDRNAANDQATHDLSQATEGAGTELTRGAESGSRSPEQARAAAGGDSPAGASDASGAQDPREVASGQAGAVAHVRDMLRALPVKGRAPLTGYDRGLFDWRADVDRNGCDTRNDILKRDLNSPTFKPGTNDCLVLSGSLRSMYSGDSVTFDRSDNHIDIDHIVALADAWQTGAAQWDMNTRRRFANDPANLIAVESSLNRQKGAGDAATWLPPHTANRCWYVSQQVAVKHTYGLWVKPAERDAVERELSKCAGTTPLPHRSPAPEVGVNQDDIVAAGSPRAGRDDASGEPRTGASDVAPEGHTPAVTEPFTNCRAAWEAGAAPVRRGEPGYGGHLDGDNDGVGCESKP